MYTREAEKDLSYLRYARPQLIRALKADDYKSLYEICRNLSDIYAARVFIVDQNDNVLVDSATVFNGRRFAQPAFFDEEITPDGKYSIQKYSDHSELIEGIRCDRFLFTAMRMEDETTLYAAFDADSVREGLRSIASKLAVASIAVIVLSAVLGFIITRSYTKPVRDLSEAIEKLSSGDFSVRVKEEGNSEFTDLSRAFNEMTGRMEMLDRSRNQFVSNASHELKTPLATIKIMVQTLLYQEVYDEGMSKEFLGDVDKEVDRLSAVVSDLLTLVGMDSGESKLNMEEFSLSDMVSDDVKRLSPLARERGIEMELNISGAIDVCGDKIKLDQVFYNLIDNAIKYTPRGEGVLVELTRQNKNAVVRVKDNGIGIPEADLKHIFDRFYRVDKARSRETGGTGLGLSIAKQIILAHSGTISVTSKLDEGSVFTVTLPVGTKSAGRQGA